MGNAVSKEKRLYLLAIEQLDDVCLAVVTCEDALPASVLGAFNSGSGFYYSASAFPASHAIDASTIGALLDEVFCAPGLSGGDQRILSITSARKTCSSSSGRGNHSSGCSLLHAKAHIYACPDKAAPPILPQGSRSPSVSIAAFQDAVDSTGVSSSSQSESSNSSTSNGIQKKTSTGTRTSISSCSNELEPASPASLDSLVQQHCSSIDPEELLESFEEPEFLGRGAFGRTFIISVPCPPHVTAAAEAAGQPELVSEGIPVVVKKLHRAWNTISTCEQEAAACLAMARSSYLPRLYCHKHGAIASYLMFEAVSSNPCNLSQRVDACAAADGPGPKHLSLLQMLSIMLDTCRGLVDFRLLLWCHCDVKPCNIILGKHGKAYLIDLGLACETGTHLNGSLRGTDAYVDPQIVLGYKQNKDLPMHFGYDFFSLGLVLVFMLVRGNDDLVAQVRDIAAKVKCSACPTQLEGVRELLTPEVSAVVEAHEQQLQQQGVLQQGEKLEGVEDELKDIVVGMLQTSSHRRLMDIPLREKLHQLMDRALGKEQQQQQGPGI